MFVTSTAEVLLPRCADFILIPSDDRKCSRYATLRQSMIPCQLNLGFEPKLSLAIRMMDVNMHARLFA
jgi:hypothetical protein